MTKQPFLTDFPLVVSATAKRRLQAAIRRTSAIIILCSLSGYAVLFEDILPGEFFASIDPTERQRSFGHIPVFWAWLAQILDANPSCQKAVGLIQKLVPRLEASGALIRHLQLLQGALPAPAFIPPADP